VRRVAGLGGSAEREAISVDMPSCDG